MSATEAMLVPVNSAPSTEMPYWGYLVSELMAKEGVKEHLDIINLAGVFACYQGDKDKAMRTLHHTHREMSEGSSRRDYFVTTVVEQQAGKLIGLATIDTGQSLHLHRAGPLISPDVAKHTPLGSRNVPLNERVGISRDHRAAYAAVWTDPTRTEHYRVEIAHATEWLRDYAPLDTNLWGIIPKRALKGCVAYADAVVDGGFSLVDEGRYYRGSDDVSKRPPKSALFVHKSVPLRQQVEA